MITVDNAQDLGKALNEGQDTITIKGDFKDKVIKIKGTGKVSWAIAIGAIGVAVIAILKMPVATVGGSVGGPVGAGVVCAVDGAIVASTAGAAVSILGLSTTIAAVSICLSVKNKNVLESLYKDYKIVEKNLRYIKISKK